LLAYHTDVNANAVGARLFPVFLKSLRSPALSGAHSLSEAQDNERGIGERQADPV